MTKTIGQFKNSIASLNLDERILSKNTLIMGEEGSGKTHLASKIRDFVIANDVPTIYLDFSNPDDSAVEARYKEAGNYFYLRFEESAAFDSAFANAVAGKENIYMAVDPSFFSDQRDTKSKLSSVFETPELLDNYYYFFHEVSLLKPFYTKFHDFLPYIFSLITMKKYGLTFLAQPYEIFEDSGIKLLFSYLYLGRCSNAAYFNTNVLKNLKRHNFYYQYRLDHKSLLFNNIRSDVVMIDE